MIGYMTDDEIRRIAISYARGRDAPKVQIPLDTWVIIPYPEPNTAEYDVNTGEIRKYRRGPRSGT
jgi:hypothetical protein